ncbi:unnamed protein product, partial [marine sediment metagenome]
DICALIIVIACCAFIGLGIDGQVKAIFGIAVGYIFGKHGQAVVAKLPGNKV